MEDQVVPKKPGRPLCLCWVRPLPQALTLVVTALPGVVLQLNMVIFFICSRKS